RPRPSCIFRPAGPAFAPEPESVRLPGNTFVKAPVKVTTPERLSVAGVMGAMTAWSTPTFDAVATPTVPDTVLVPPARPTKAPRLPTPRPLMVRFSGVVTPLAI